MVNHRMRLFLLVVLLLACLISTLIFQELLFPIGILMIGVVFFIIMEILDNKYDAILSIIAAFSLLVYILIWISFEGMALDRIIFLIIFLGYIIIRGLAYLGYVPKKWFSRDDE